VIDAPGSRRCDASPACLSMPAGRRAGPADDAGHPTRWAPVETVYAGGSGFAGRRLLTRVGQLPAASTRWRVSQSRASA
jgi:hypothetical protein